MSKTDQELAARLTAINSRLNAVSLRLVESLPRANEQRADNGLNGDTLREIGRDLVSLAGALTTLGVEMARSE